MLRERIRVVGRIVPLHRKGWNVRHKGIIVRHLCWRCMIEIVGRIRRVSFVLKRVKIFLVLFVLLNAPWGIVTILRISMMHFFSLDFLIGILRKVLLLRCLNNFSLHTLFSTLFCFARTILNVLFPILLECLNELQYFGDLITYVFLSAFVFGLELSDGIRYLVDVFLHLLGFLQDKFVKCMLMNLICLQWVSDDRDCFLDRVDLIGELKNPSSSKVVLLCFVLPHVFVESFKLGLKDSCNMLAYLFDLSLKIGQEFALKKRLHTFLHNFVNYAEYLTIELILYVGVLLDLSTRNTDLARILCHKFLNF